MGISIMMANLDMSEKDSKTVWIAGYEAKELLIFKLILDIIISKII